MLYLTELGEKVISVSCPTCDAKVGILCTTRSGKATGRLHKARHDKAVS